MTHPAATPLPGHPAGAATMVSKSSKLLGYVNYRCVGHAP